MSKESEKNSGSSSNSGSHYELKSFNSEIVDSQNSMQPKYCEPGPAGGDMQGAKQNSQTGP